MLIVQPSALNLVHSGVAREARDLDDFNGPHDARQTLNCRERLLQVNSRICNPQDDALTAHRVRSRPDRELGQLRFFFQRTFHEIDRNVFAVDSDGFAHPLDEDKVSEVVDAASVARVKPAVGIRRGV
ncbi:hypothetical protein D3C86_1615070 [compost metagenome]